MLENLLNTQVKEIQVSGIRRFSMLASQYPDAIALTIGQPDFPTPRHVKEAAKRAIDANFTSYTPNAGMLSLREAAARFVSTKYGLEYAAETEVIVTNGASEAIDIALRTLLSPGDEVILPGPVYPGYEPIIHMCQAVTVHVDTRETDFVLTAEGIARKLSERTRCVILPTPSNPTGVRIREDELLRIAELLRNRSIFVLADEIYSELVYDGTHHSIATIPGMRDCTVIINGLSKSHAMTGWRIGFTFAPAYITQHMVKVHQYNATCASSISQAAALEALTAGANDSAPMRDAYIRRRDYVDHRLRAMGLSVVRPDSAFYFFPSIEPFSTPVGLDSFSFAAQLLERERLAVVPGSSFSRFGEGHIRISYAYSEAVLEDGLNRLERFLHTLHLA